MSDFINDNVLPASRSVLVNGIVDNIGDVVYIKAESFNMKQMPQIAWELENINRTPVDGKIPYLLISFSRRSTTARRGGIPGNFSPGSHFFHSITSFQIIYFSLYHGGQNKLNWGRLNRRSAVAKTRLVKHVGHPSPLKVQVDGRLGQGVIFYE